ncbi:MAG: recombinase family protein, partial [Caldilineaceae bacterium]
MATALRFAILCRVSTESQEKEGQSLEVQQKTLRECVDMIGGIIIKEYIGQEHGTKGHERPILDEMIVDARKKEFDALMIYDLSRLTRDPSKSKFILAELKNSGIKLYVQTQLYSLDNPETNLIVGLLAEINAFQSATQVQKSIESKIELAKKGWHVFGHPPYGRKLEHKDYAKPPVWVVDPDALKKAQEIYDYYINQGTYVDKLAGLIGMSRHTIFSILKDKGQFKQTLDYNGKKMEFITPVPPLFTEEQRAIIKQRLKKNKKNNGNKYDYLLSGLVKCSKCGLH